MKYESKKNLNWCKLAEALHRQWRIQGRGLRGQPPFIFRPNRGQDRTSHPLSQSLDEPLSEGLDRPLIDIPYMYVAYQKGKSLVEIQ